MSSFSERRGRDRARHPQHDLAELAEHGVVLRHVATASGVKLTDVDEALADGFLLGDGNGAYRLAGAERTGVTAELAALGACTGLAVGLWSAMARAGIHLRWLPNDSAHVHVLIDAASNAKSTDWYTTHPTRRLDPDLETRFVDDVRITVPARTIRDFVAFLPRTPASERQLDAWVDEARGQNKLEVRHLAEAAEMERAAQVRKRLMRLHDRHVGIRPAEFKSIGEAWLRDLIRRMGLPEPLWNAVPPGGSKPVDAYYPEIGLIIEFDGYWVHRVRGKHNRDRRGDRRHLVSHGLFTVRITKDDFENDLAQLESDLVFLITNPPLRRAA